jgi:hypothetical protein
MKPEDYRTTATFAARIRRVGIIRCVDVPEEISRKLGSERYICVAGRVEGLPLRGTLVPRGKGRHRLAIHSRIWRKLRVDAGAAVEVTLERDEEPREPRLPQDLAAALAEEPQALAAYRNFTTALRREFVNWIFSAKKSETRTKRIATAVRRLREMRRKGKKR